MKTLSYLQLLSTLLSCEIALASLIHMKSLSYLQLLNTILSCEIALASSKVLYKCPEPNMKKFDSRFITRPDFSSVKLTLKCMPLFRSQYIHDQNFKIKYISFSLDSSGKNTMQLFHASHIYLFLIHSHQVEIQNTSPLNKTHYINGRNIAKKKTVIICKG